VAAPSFTVRSEVSNRKITIYPVVLIVAFAALGITLWRDKSWFALGVMLTSLALSYFLGRLWFSRGK